MKGFWRVAAVYLWAPLVVLHAADIYVSPKASGGGSGSKAQPFGALQQARDAERKARQQNPGEPVTVWLHGGDYPVDQSFSLTAADSGTAAAPTTFRAVEGETPRLLSARRLHATDFHRITDAATLARIPEPLRGKIVALDLKSLGIRHSQRYPDLFNDFGGLVNLYFAGERMPLARYPNSGYASIKRVLDTGGGLQDRNWSKPTNVKPVSATNPGTFEYREDAYAHFAAWQRQLDRGVWLKGYWRIPWENEAVRLASIDTVNHTATLAKPVPGGIGNKYSRPEGNGAEQFWLLNLLEEVDAPGEWCVDFRDQKLYFYPPSPLEKAEILLADSDAPAIELSGAEHIVVRGLVMEGSLGNGVEIKDSSDNLLAGCTVRNQGRYAVKVEGGFRNRILSNDLYALGAGGVWLSGGNETASPRIPAGHQVVNNHIHHFAQIERVYAPGINSGYTGGGGGGHHTAVGMYIAHNLIHDTPHAGVLFGSWDSLFEYNEVFRYCTVSNDMGAFYSYDNATRMGNITFRYNLMHDSDEGDGLYWDYDHKDMHVYGNIAYLKSAGKRGYGFLYKIGNQAKEPYSIDCYNNIAIACNLGFEIVDGLPAQSTIHDNVSVMSKTPWQFSQITGGSAIRMLADFATGKMFAFSSDPGFVDLEHLDLRLKPGSRLMAQVPGFQPIPVEKIGLFVDEYRKTLPSAESIDRYNKHTKMNGLSYDILDRKQ